MLVFFTVVPKFKSGHPNRLHYVLLNVVSVFQACNFFNNTAQEEVADVGIILLPAWPLRERSVIDAPLKQLFLVELV